MLGGVKMYGFVLLIWVTLSLAIKADDPKPIVADILTNEWREITAAKKVPIKLGQRRCGVAFNGVTLPCAVRPHLPSPSYKTHMDFNTIY